MMLALYYIIVIGIILFSAYGLYDVCKQTKALKDKLDNHGRDTQ